MLPYCTVLKEKMLDVGFCLPATCPLVPVRLEMPGKLASLAWQAGRLRLPARRAGILVFKDTYLFPIQHQASSIQYLPNLT
jgi:hypothetical protein